MVMLISEIPLIRCAGGLGPRSTELIRLMHNLGHQGLLLIREFIPLYGIGRWDMYMIE